MEYKFNWKCIAFNEYAASFDVKVRESGIVIGEINVLTNKSGICRLCGNLSMEIPESIQDQIFKECYDTAKNVLWQ